MQKALVQRAVPAYILPVCKLRLNIVLRRPPPEAARDGIFDRPLCPIGQIQNTVVIGETPPWPMPQRECNVSHGHGQTPWCEIVTQVISTERFGGPAGSR
ncbi:MAG TPA: hypothetical protein DHU55_03325 [Blastocatellia bacterium]|nr:hypothetical protein [Blastocatellia bacterium]HCX28791.1 hypothetical protein [Blastocatellia bacterium]